MDCSPSILFSAFLTLAGERGNGDGALVFSPVPSCSWPQQYPFTEGNIPSSSTHLVTTHSIMSYVLLCDKMC